MLHSWLIISRYCLGWSFEAMHLFLPTYCSTVAPCEGTETHNNYGCSAVHYIVFLVVCLFLPALLSEYLFFFLIFHLISILIFDKNSVANFLLLFTVPSKQQPSVCSTPFSHMVVYHGVLLGYINPLMRWAHFSKGVHICILAYLLLPLHHVGEYYIAKCQF